MSVRHWNPGGGWGCRVIRGLAGSVMRLCAQACVCSLQCAVCGVWWGGWLRAEAAVRPEAPLFQARRCRDKLPLPLQSLVHGCCTVGAAERQGKGEGKWASLLHPSSTRSVCGAGCSTQCAQCHVSKMQAVQASPVDPCDFRGCGGVSEAPGAVPPPPRWTSSVPRSHPFVRPSLPPSLFPFQPESPSPPAKGGPGGGLDVLVQI